MESDEHLRQPRLRAGIQVHPPTGEGEPWTLQRDEHHYLRAGADLAALATRLDGARDADGLAELMGPPWTPESVNAAVAVLDGSQLIARPDDPPPRKSRRVKYVPPLTVQFTVVRSGDRIAKWITRRGAISPRALAIFVLLLAVAGAGALASKADQIERVLGTPISITTLVVVLLAVSVTTVAHELGHACLLSAYGGRPGRLGVMIFYLSPAMFCDVSDAWRLNHLQRARVALAGILVQLGVSGAAASTAGFAGNGGTSEVLVLFALVNLAAAVVNMVPFVKLDGYIAVMSYLDRPNLRATALRSLREHCVAVIAGRRDKSLEPAWLPWFGLGCVLVPIALVVRVLGRWLDALLSLGYFGFALSTVLAGFLFFITGKAMLGLVKAFRGSRPRWPRLITAAAVATALLAAIANIRLEISQNVSYVVTGDGQAVLRVPNGIDDLQVRAGDRVELVESGMVLHRSVGTATVTSSQGQQALIPLSGLIPVKADNVKILGSLYPLQMDSSGLPRSGSAKLHTRSVPLIGWLYERLVKPFAAPFN